MKAPDFLNKAAKLMEDRGKQRDSDEGERSMARCVNAFNAMTGHSLTVEDGWQFMVYLKHSRMRAGGFTQDDYEDAVAYEALMAEEALSAQPYTKVVENILIESTSTNLYCKPGADCKKCPHPCM